MQSFDEIPTSLILEAKAIGGEVWVCVPSLSKNRCEPL